ncbi:metallophosphoesterase family protein [Rathayibacter rathayi]|uniref:Phosphoesterase n=1 Tax=Rathayibacter rathayi TaxID=33887 RepID=A0ABD6W4R8_RATRA|nr:YfcE family phosphodiesterase [Rathayibacter rathayi]AZZ49657.1 YfcE family phosphodiesterase [Rathayibacter rathayi]MWV75321.1 YfcE family phosphodiesterase [Rathayibacter rathayi NCPPB 2980 = VKM Ac-1601]PPF09639.1 YfcE family phosphodiesterase [Rathayibacter rathayi]PPF42778.1 YfcE family phosphodiesterase [Rathayibacter rathayi]PPF75309.1 YfcE family phosphodiesterase [Rathayibacter rathayi]
MPLLQPGPNGAPPALGGPVRLLLLADTHLPKRAKALPDEVWQEIDEADLVVHAGDWVDEATLDALEQRASLLLAVWGNNDPEALRARLPAVAHARVAGLDLRVVHETGPATGRETRADAAFPGADVLIFGHSHIPWDSVSPAGLRLLNPGSPTDRRRQPACTYLTAVAEDGALREVRLSSLPQRVQTVRSGGARGSQSSEVGLSSPG